MSEKCEYIDLNEKTNKLFKHTLFRRVPLMEIKNIELEGSSMQFKR